MAQAPGSHYACLKDKEKESGYFTVLITVQ